MPHEDLAGKTVILAKASRATASVAFRGAVGTTQTAQMISSRRCCLRRSPNGVVVGGGGVGQRCRDKGLLVIDCESFGTT